jgi:nucleoside-diphosphate-sugar epimerase
MARLLVLGAGYLGAAIAARALDAGDDVTLADNWFATDREQAEAVGAQVVDADIRHEQDVAALFAERPDRVIFTAAQASRPLSFEDPAYTEQSNLVGPRIVAQAVAGAGGIPVVYASSLHVYGGGLTGEVGADRPYGEQGDLAHLSKVYAELLLKMEAKRHGFPLALLRLGIVYGPSPVEHDRPESVTVVDKFRRQAAAGEPLTLDAGAVGATIGVVHVADAARIFHEARDEVANVAAETITVGDVAALAEGREPAGDASWAVASPFTYEHRVAEYLRR